MRIRRGRLVSLLTIAIGLSGCPGQDRPNPFGPISEEVVVESGTLVASGTSPRAACLVRGTMRNLTGIPRHAETWFVAFDDANQDIGRAIKGVDLEPRQRKAYEASFIARTGEGLAPALPCDRIVRFALTKLNTCDPTSVSPFSSLCP